MPCRLRSKLKHLLPINTQLRPSWEPWPSAHRLLLERWRRRKLTRPSHLLSTPTPYVPASAHVSANSAPRRTASVSGHQKPPQSGHFARFREISILVVRGSARLRAAALGYGLVEFARKALVRKTTGDDAIELAAQSPPV